MHLRFCRLGGQETAQPVSMPRPGCTQLISRGGRLEATDSLRFDVDFPRVLHPLLTSLWQNLLVAIEFHASRGLGDPATLANGFLSRSALVEGPTKSTVSYFGGGFRY